jgi:hypothetical protein
MGHAEWDKKQKKALLLYFKRQEEELKEQELQESGCGIPARSTGAPLVCALRFACGLVAVISQSLHSLFRLQGWGVRPHLFLAGSRGVLRFFWLLRGHFGDFAMKSSAGGHDSYASCYFISADIKIK